MDPRYDYYGRIVESVGSAVHAIQDIPLELCFNEKLIEHELIPRLGLNDEILNEQPPELEAFFGSGLHLWQYPNQFSKYLVWLSYNAKHITSYMEIGCRWGGTFIVVMEWLKKIGCNLQFGVAVDMIDPTPFIEEYTKLSSVPVLYFKGSSNSENFRSYFNTCRPDMVFIDGDHSMYGVMNDHLIVRKSANLIVHHDIVSIACPETTLFWNYIKQTEDHFDHSEFIDQYESVNGSFLGIGVLKRR